MSALGSALGALAEILDDAALAWFVFGAQAVAVRGAPRATQDIDVTVRIDRIALPALVSRLESAGFSHRYADLADELMTTGSVLPLVHTPSGMEVDLVLAGSGLEALALGRSTRERIDGVLVPVVSASDLVVMKVLAGRGRDLEDVRGILAGDEVDLEEARDLLTQLEEALGQSDLIPAFEAALRDVQKGR